MSAFFGNPLDRPKALVVSYPRGMRKSDSSAPMNATQAAHYLKMTANTFRKLCLSGDGPRHVTVENSSYYEQSELDRWLKANPVRTNG